ncbi:MAG: protein-export chaperone SecB [Halieaceae bacterium]|jgi:preprotein translocase subunit SecB|nr:protein-export chaperone SecB [Halieaceae bacterium]
MAEEQAAAPEAPVQQFTIQRIYTKDVSFESPSTPGVFRKQWQPAVNVDLNTKSSKVDEENNYEVIVTLTVTAKIDDETAFLVEVQQAGIFYITGVEGEAMRQLLAIMAPNILFPYAREAIDGLVMKGGFPPLALAPINFEAMYRQAMAQQQAQQQAAAAEEPATH